MFLRKIIIGFIIVLFYFCSVPELALAGFGISPPWVKNEHLLPGTSFEQIVYLVRRDSENDLYIKVDISDSLIKGWIRIEQKDNFKIPKGIKQFPMKVIISAPEDTLPGKYNGKISLSTYSKENNGSGIAVKTALGAEIEVDLKVSLREFSSFSVQRFLLPDFEVDSPIKFFLKVENKGNIELELDKVQIDIFDKELKVLLDSFVDNELGKIESFKTGELLVEFPTDLEIGEYWAKIKIYKDGKIYEEEKLFFSVLKEKLEEKGVVKASLETNPKIIIREEARKGYTTILLLFTLIGVSIVVLAGSLYLSRKSIKK